MQGNRPFRRDALATALVLVLSGAGLRAETVEFAASFDTTIYEDATGASNGAGDYLFMGMTGEDNGIPASLRRALIAFDLSAIPANAIIDSVQVEFTIDKEAGFSAIPGSAALHRLSRPWGEGATDANGAEGRGAEASPADATWMDAFHGSVAWTNPGGDFAGAASGTAPFGAGSVPEPLVFATGSGLVADVRAWVRQPASNFGWILLGDEVTIQNARRLVSRDCPQSTCPDQAPKLIVDYAVPSVVDHLALTELTDGLTNPVGIVHAGDGSGRLFIVEQEGIIRIFDTAGGTLLGTPFLDIQAEVYSMLDPNGGNEQGLLGLAFHPDYANNGRLFVNYTNNPSANVWHTVVAEFAVSGDPDVAMGIGSTVLEFPQEAKNHNGGDLHFGPDGYLYIASGDGGGSGDTYGNAQDLGTLRGALLRIDVDSAPPPGAELCGLVSEYGIPPGNPFPGGDDGCDEILHYGLRNPWRFSIDAFNGDLWIADVGQNAWEEVNRVPGSAAGLNFGWPCREGKHVYDAGETCLPPLTEPVLEYAQANGNCSVTGGYLYRGNRLPLAGHHLFGDYCTGRMWVASGSGDVWTSEEWPAAGSALNFLSSFGQDENCELYAVERAGGSLYRIDDAERLFGAGFESRLCR
jgi:glucose/arabinose dehydrogenase